MKNFFILLVMVAVTFSAFAQKSAAVLMGQVEDENGCRATTTFEVRPYCKEVAIPNMFSPNGDGANDVWEISGLEEKNATVTVFDRNGQAVFQSQGYNIPWDGSYNGRLVPVGAYYYLIIVDDQQYRGPVTVLY